MIGRRRFAALLPAAALWAAALQAQEPRAKRELVVFAAASLTEAFTAMGQSFEQAHPAVAVRFNFAGSQQLALQLREGAQADVFASADDRAMERVRQRGLLVGPAVTFARNELVGILPAANPGRVGQLQELARPGVKLVLGARSVPAGNYARQALEQLGRLAEFGPDFPARVLGNLVSEEENVRGVVAKVLLGEADAGIVYRSDVTRAVAGRLQVLPMPAAAAVSVRYPIAAIRSGSEPELALAFVRQVLSDSGQALLTRHGLLPAASVAGPP